MEITTEMPPPEIIEAAYSVGNWMESQPCTDWEIGPVVSRGWFAKVEAERDKLREINANGALAWDLLQSQLAATQAELKEARALAEHNAQALARALIELRREQPEADL
jgi:hypothetical protein